MNTALTISLFVLFILIATWAVYNFYWLAKPQVFLVLSNTSGAAFDQKTSDAVASAVGGKLATFSQLTDAYNAGASLCAYGFVDCTGCTGACITGCRPTTVGSGSFGSVKVMGVTGLTGSSVNCGANGIAAQTNWAGGYWIYGKKPVSTDVTVTGSTAKWTILPFIDNSKFPSDGRVQYNQFSIFNIPKII